MTLVSLRCWSIRFLLNLNRIIAIFSEDVFQGHDFYSKSTSGVEVRWCQLELKLVRQIIRIFCWSSISDNDIEEKYSEKLLCSRAYYWFWRWMIDFFSF